MSGHSKWAQIKRSKEKTDAQRAKIFTKISRELAAAIKLGGPSVESNSKLRDVIAKAKQNNMSLENINRAIKKASSGQDATNYESITYEGYGIGGSAVIVECLTDNKNRTASEVRHIFDKFGGSLGTTNSVSYMFSRKGVILVDKSANFDELFEFALENGADEIEQYDEGIEIQTKPEDFSDIFQAINEKGYKVISSEIDYIPSTTIELDAQKLSTFEKMIEMFEDSDDVQNVYHNVELPEREDGE